MKRVFLLFLIGVVSLFTILSIIKNPLTTDKKTSRSFVPQNRTQDDVAKNQRPLDFQLTLAPGFTISSFAEGLGNARDLEFTPQGTLLLSSPNKGTVFALPDRNSDGVADNVIPVIEGLQTPHGLAFHNGRLFVVSEDKVAQYSWNETTLTATLDKVLFSLPSGGGHNRYTIAFNKKGNMFVSLGSTCNVCVEKHPFRAKVLISNENGDNPRIFAQGLRNAPFITVHPETQELWGTEMGRDWLGDNKPPDEINIIKAGKDYGWPICYGNKIHDKDFDIQLRKASPCEASESPIYEIAAHSAPLGLTFIDSEQFPKGWQGDLLVAYHGSWNRSTPIGYKVVRMDVEGNRILSEQDLITGFLPSNAIVGEEAHGRPVDLIFDKKGNLFISDDKKGAIYKVTRK